MDCFASGQRFENCSVLVKKPPNPPKRGAEIQFWHTAFLLSLPACWSNQSGLLWPAGSGPKSEVPSTLCVLFLAEFADGNPQISAEFFSASSLHLRHVLASSFRRFSQMEIAGFPQSWASTLQPLIFNLFPSPSTFPEASLVVRRASFFPGILSIFGNN